MQICKGKTKTGAPCRAPAGKGGLCFLHANPNEAQKQGRLGGLKNRRTPVDVEVPDNPSAADIWTITAQAMRLLLAGELGAREASAFAQLSNSMSRIIPTAELENRVTMLEQQLTQEGQAAHEEDGIAPAGDSTGKPADEIEAAETDVSEREAPSSGAAMEYEDVSEQEAAISEAAMECEDVSAQEALSSEATIQYEQEAEIPSDESGEAEEP